ncbi:carboxypeptidase regulatory-like domain-containing protein [Natronorubrum halophilum]|uniref:carboxypeptidase regulatory-like domain-containing protein n=1 Tax=Natronorubrum halophilum TaxID=1702106 RepID=UPI000EF6A51D|nr:carboxypeptidase regulatory-like domain-containing protein [Natronorubrum halophilum]
MRVKRPLILELSRHEVPVGQPVTVRARDKGNRPIEGAIVEAGSKRKRTDERGLCEITFHAPGFWRLVARKSPTDRVAYKPASTLVRAVPRPSTSRSPHRPEPRVL